MIAPAMITINAPIRRHVRVTTALVTLESLDTVGPMAMPVPF